MMSAKSPHGSILHFAKQHRLTPTSAMMNCLNLVHEMRYPSQKTLGQLGGPLIERNPLLFWKSTSFVLLATVVGLLIYLNQLLTALNN